MEAGQDGRHGHVVPVYMDKRELDLAQAHHLPGLVVHVVKMNGKLNHALVSNPFINSTVHVLFYFICLGTSCNNYFAEIAFNRYFFIEKNVVI